MTYLRLQHLWRQMVFQHRSIWLWKFSHYILTLNSCNSTIWHLWSFRLPIIMQKWYQENPIHVIKSFKDIRQVCYSNCRKTVDFKVTNEENLFSHSSVSPRQCWASESWWCEHQPHPKVIGPRANSNLILNFENVLAEPRDDAMCQTTKLCLK